MTTTKWCVLAGSIFVGLLVGAQMFPNSAGKAIAFALFVGVVVVGLQTPARDRHIKP